MHTNIVWIDDRLFRKGDAWSHRHDVVPYKIKGDDMTFIMSYDTYIIYKKEQEILKLLEGSVSDVTREQMIKLIDELVNLNRENAVDEYQDNESE